MKTPTPPKEFVWPRSDPAALAAFDESTKVCTMNCGQSTHDPRSKKECKFQCDDCVVLSLPNAKVRDAASDSRPLDTSRE